MTLTDTKPTPDPYAADSLRPDELAAVAARADAELATVAS